MSRIAGLPNTESNRALDMYMKTRYLGERKGGVVFATGTPISNTMGEMYTMQRYLAPKMLMRAAGVAHFDAWAGNFRRGGHVAGTCAGRLRLPDAHPLRQVREPARIAFDVPQLRRRADGRHAQACLVQTWREANRRSQQRPPRRN